ncbi:META domain-containing protein [Psychroflexus salis]|uniref:DUF306 domain-containing protein n=1 Tax=Psychroflexus salis TaxID=1526574 RepID=A0A916ZR08_9FLAO|nr:META domain-containing protein [Psychroflexus salis]GGE08493.1 hypothetical protein GCM10010831_07560 [Psychroflexus salis]
MRNLFVLSLFIIVFSACKSVKTNQKMEYSTEFESKSYQLIRIESLDVEAMDLVLKVNAEENIMSGESGCNNYQFNYNLKENVLDLGYGVATKMYCEDNMETENALFSAASRVRHFSQVEGELYLLDETGEVLLKAKEKQEQD